MPQYTALLRTVSADKFAEILTASGRKNRETFFHRHDIRAKKTSGLPRAGAKNEQRTAALLAALAERDDEELSEQMLRTWLLTKRPLLAAALDHLGIAHRDGLTDSDDVNRFERLSADEAKGMLDKLTGVASAEDVTLYLKFMGAPLT